MWQRLVVLAAIAAGGGGVNAQGGSPAIRPEDAGIRVLIASGMERSATFRDLTAQVDHADVIVYIRFSRCPRGIPACLVWITADTGPRRLLIKLDRFGRSLDELTAWLAHGLHHANEVGSAPEVRDLASFERFFATRGWKHRDGFETEEARTITRKVAAELIRAEPDAGRRPPRTDRK
jgi:hypothetical protein